MNDEPGTIVPFNMFYDALEQFLDHSHKGVISRALDNEYLNPNHEKECFDVNVLKTLFMIKYVKEIKANIENITSLMVSNVNDDRMALAQQVEDALKRLVRQTLVQKNGDIYVFLTDEEQEINRAIESQNVDSGEVIAKVSEMIFDGLYDERSIAIRHSTEDMRLLLIRLLMINHIRQIRIMTLHLKSLLRTAMSEQMKQQ